MYRAMAAVAAQLLLAMPLTMGMLAASHQQKPPVLVAPGATYTSSDSSATHTFSHVVPSGLLASALVVYATSGSQNITRVTYAGQQLELQVNAGHNGNTSNTTIWLLKSPPVGTANVVITLAASYGTLAVAENYSNVDQLAPVGNKNTSIIASQNQSVTVAKTNNTSLALGLSMAVKSGLGATTWNAPSVRSNYITSSTNIRATNGVNAVDGTISLTHTAVPDGDVLLVMELLGDTGSIFATQVFDTSGVWTKPSTGTTARIQVWGGGGAGATRSSGANQERASGGGGGAYEEITVALSTLGATETVTVGLGGAGGSVAGNPGQPGQASSFGTHLTADYGRGGVEAFESSVVGGAGGFSTTAGWSGGKGGDAPTSNAKTNGGDSVWGGAGGASGDLNGSSLGGTSTYGGKGGNGATAGTVPGGGGGHNITPSAIVGGGHGRVIITVT